MDVSNKELAVQYFNDNPSQRDEVLKAYFAFHVPHFRLDEDSHNFTTGDRESNCLWCGRTREMVRYDDLPGPCQARPEIIPISQSILEEEKKAFKLFDSASKNVPKLISKMGLTGKTLAILHHTHGYDPETVAGIVEIPSKLMDDYKLEMELEKARSRENDR
jgi:hypothetical protein